MVSLPPISLELGFLPFCAPFFIVIFWRFRQCNKRPFKLPPGPRPWPIIGNFLDMPSDNQEWITFATWGRQYGDVSSVTVLGQPIVIVNSTQAAVELLEKRSSVTSARHNPVFAGDMVGWKDTLVLLQYGERFRRYRKFFYTCIGTVSAMRKFHPAKENESRKLLRRILAEPADLREHLKYTIGASLMSDTYGYIARDVGDPCIEVANAATEQFSRATLPPGYLVDYIPALSFLPKWFPGAKFKQEAVEWGSTLSNMVNRPFDFVKQQLASGIAPISFTSNLMGTNSMSPNEEHDLKWAAASLLSGGMDTSLSAIYSFVLAMVLFPEVQKKAQLEIDHVVGPNRLPIFADRPDLPYINAVVTEALRWHSTVPLCIPHRASEDEVCRGYLIPKGSLIIVNIWGINHDERVYNNPMAFNPDRYFPKPNGRDGGEPNPRKVTFGFGRRSCPGAQLADANLFITISTILATFNISNAVEDGVVIKPTHANMPGTISHPSPFKCSITPRSDQAITLIR